VKKKDAGIRKETRVGMEGREKRELGKRREKCEERRGISRLAPRLTDQSHGPDFAVF